MADWDYKITAGTVSLCAITYIQVPNNKYEFPQKFKGIPNVTASWEGRGEAPGGTIWNVTEDGFNFFTSGNEATAGPNHLYVKVMGELAD